GLRRARAYHRPMDRLLRWPRPVQPGSDDDEALPAPHARSRDHDRRRHDQEGFCLMADERHPSAMTERFGWLQRLVASGLTEHVHVDANGVSQVRQLAARGTIVYVLRNRSLLDYCLI